MYHSEVCFNDLGHFGRTAKKSASTQENETPHLNRGKSDDIVHEEPLEKVDLWHQQSHSCGCSLRMCILRAEGWFVSLHGCWSNQFQCCRPDLVLGFRGLGWIRRAEWAGEMG